MMLTTFAPWPMVGASVPGVGTAFVPRSSIAWNQSVVISHLLRVHCSSALQGLVGQSHQEIRPLPDGLFYLGCPLRRDRLHPHHHVAARDVRRGAPQLAHDATDKGGQWLAAKTCNPMAEESTPEELAIGRSHLRTVGNIGQELGRLHIALIQHGYVILSCRGHRCASADEI